MSIQTPENFDLISLGKKSRELNRWDFLLTIAPSRKKRGSEIDIESDRDRLNPT